MNDKTLSFTEINIIRAPGFRHQGLKIEDIVPQINIIYGPNAVGKTTTARSLGHLLWPDKNVSNTAVITGKFNIGKYSWFVEMDNDKIEYQKNGISSPPPPLPPLEHRDRYFFALHDLLQKGTADKSLAELIIRESAGGYQISDSAAELAYRENASGKGKNTREAEKKASEYKQKIQEQRDLLTEESKLKQLSAELVEINDARQRLNLIEQAVEYAKAKQKYQMLGSEFEQFPDLMEKIDGGEADKLVELENKLLDYSQKKKEAEDLADSARKILEDIDLPEEGIEEGFITEIKNKNEELKVTEDEINNIEREIAETVSKRKEEEANFKDLKEKDNLKDIDGPAYNQLSNFARRAEEIENRLSSLESLKKFLFSGHGISETESLIEDGIRCLEKWLSSPEENDKLNRKTRYLSLFTGILLAIIIFYNGYNIDSRFFFLFLILPFIFWYGFGNKSQKLNFRKEAQEEFSSLGLTTPSSWEQTEVKQCLRKLRKQQADMKLYTSKKQYWQDISSEYSELKEKKQKIKEEREELINRFGTAPDTSEQTLYFFSNRLSRWQDAHHALVALNHKKRETKNYYDKLRNNINHMLADYGYLSAQNAAQISRYITNLEERNNRCREAARNLQEAENNISEAENKIKKFSGRKKELFISLGLEEENEKELKNLCEQFEDYVELKDELSRVEHQKNVEKMKLKEYNNYSHTLLAKDLAELKSEKEELQHKSANYEHVLEEITSIRTKIEAAKGKRSVEEAYTDKERALDKLEVQLNDDYDKVAGWVLADFISEINISRNRPQVFKRAREIFANITRGSYQLEIENGDPPTFWAIDTVSGRGKSLNQLSSGTRIQLLMSVRMAFLDREEEGLKLPLYFDETLANSDDIRAEAMITAIIELVRQGRQCFYFTAQQDEVHKWIYLLDRETEINYKIINLGEKNKEDMGSIKDLPVPEAIFSIPEEIPDTAELSHEAYGKKISVPPFDPLAGTGQVHIWYIIEDTELLKCFLETGIYTWGQLKTLLNTEKLAFIHPEKRNLLPEIKGLGHCLEEYVESWKVGRGKPVDRSVLLATDAVTDTFIDEVSQLADEVEGQAAEILNRLREGSVTRFRKDKIEELEEFFLEENYLSSAEKLSGEQIFARMLGCIKDGEFRVSGEKVRKLMKRLSNK